MMTGRFWLPEDPATDWVGDLSFAPGEPARLRLETAPPGIELGGEILLHGYLEKPMPSIRVREPRAVSLLDAWVSRQENLFGPGGARVVVNHLIVGAHCRTFPRVDCRRLTTDRLSEWLSEDLFDWRRSGSRFKGVRLRRPTTLKTTLGHGGTVALTTRLSGPVISRGPTATITSEASARFAHPAFLTEPQWEESYVQPFRALVSFLTARECRVTDSVLLLRQTVARDIVEAVEPRRGSHARVPVWSSRHVQADRPVQDWEPWNHLLPRAELAGREEALLQDWWQLSERLGIVLFQLASFVARRSRYDDGGFFALVASLEAYAGLEHKALWTEPSSLRSDLKLVKRAVAGLSNEGRIRDALAHADEATFAEQLACITDRLGDVQTSIGWDESLAKEIRLARNHLAHGRGSRAPRLIQEPGRVVETTDRLRAIAAASLLLDLGIDQAGVHAALDRVFGGYRWYGR